MHRVLPEALGKVHEDRVELASVFQLCRAQQDPVDIQVVKQIELDPSVVLEHPESDRVLTADELLFGINPDVEIIRKQIIVSSMLAIFAAKNVGARGRGWRSGLGRLRPNDAYQSE